MANVPPGVKRWLAAPTLPKILSKPARVLCAIAIGSTASSILGEWLAIAVTEIWRWTGGKSEPPDWANDYAFFPAVLLIGVIAGCLYWWGSGPAPRRKRQIVPLVLRGMVGLAVAYAVADVCNARVGLHRSGPARVLISGSLVLAFAGAFVAVFWATG